MPDLIVSIFQLRSNRFKAAPKTSFHYEERDTGVRWHITAGGSRAYFLRFGDNLASADPEEIGKQNADSHFMMSRLGSGLLMGGEGLFTAEAVGRVFIAECQPEPHWYSQLNLTVIDPPLASDAVYDWIGSFTRHVILRRAAADAHAALVNPAEAGLFVYRGLEWLVVGEKRRWEDLAEDMGISKKDVRDFKKLVNVDYGVRHASRSGEKLRGEFETYPFWVAGLMDAINATRARLDEGFKPTEPAVIAAAIEAAVPMEPYP